MSRIRGAPPVRASANDLTRCVSSGPQPVASRRMIASAIAATSPDHHRGGRERLDDTPDIGGHDGPPRSLGLERDPGRGLPEGRHHDHVRCGIPLLRTLGRAGKADALRRPGPQPLLGGALPDEDQSGLRDLGPDAGPGVGQQFLALEVGQRSDADRHGHLLRQPERCPGLAALGRIEATQVHQGRDDRDGLTDPGADATGLLGLAGADHHVGTLGGQPVPPGGTPVVGAAGALEGPLVRLEDRRATARHHAPARHPRLGGVQVHDVRLPPRRDPAQVPRLGGRRLRRSAGVPVQAARTERLDVQTQLPGRGRGDGDLQSGGDLLLHVVPHQVGHPSRGQVRHVQHAVATWCGTLAHPLLRVGVSGSPQAAPPV